MTSWVGPLGSLVRVPCVSQMQVGVASGVVTRHALGGAPYTVRLGRDWREWSLGRGVLSRAEVGLLAQLSRTQSAPWRLIPDQAHLYNLLTPYAAAWEDWVPSRAQAVLTRHGPVVLPGEEVAATHVQMVGEASTLNFHTSPVVPVLPGGVVTVSMWMMRTTGAGRGVRLEWVDAAGVEVSLGPWAAVSVPAGQWARRVVTATAPAGAAGLRVSVRQTSFAALPQVTWTAGEVAWADGQAAEAVVLGPAQESPVLLLGDREITAAQWVAQEVASW